MWPPGVWTPGGLGPELLKWRHGSHFSIFDKRLFSKTILCNLCNSCREILVKTKMSTSFKMSGGLHNFDLEEEQWNHAAGC